MSFAEVDHGWQIIEVLVETKRKYYRSGSTDFDCAQVELVIGALLLGERDADLFARWKAALEEVRPGQ